MKIIIKKFTVGFISGLILIALILLLLYFIMI